MTSPQVNVDLDRVSAELETLAGFSDAAAPAVTRVLFSSVDMQARRYIKSLCRAANLEVRTDAVGNMFARWNGSQPELPAVGTGSHCDAIPHSGRYDGTVGVLGGLEAIRAIRRSGVHPKRSIELLMFTAEEPTRFGLGCLGSRLLSGVLDPAAADKLADTDGKTLAEVRADVGLTDPLSNVRLPAGYYRAFIELHIEQGPILENENVPIGVVTSIAAPATVSVDYQGLGGHAGAVLMPERRDALAAAAELVLAVEDAAGISGGSDTVATTGVLQVHPGAVNSIPSQVHLEIDIRDIDGDRRDEVLDSILVAAQAIGQRREMNATVEVVNADPPATCAPDLVAAVQAASKDGELACKEMISRAYHDSLFMAVVAPTAMIFIPCRDGVSHRPDEFASTAAISNGISVLARTLFQLASSE
jgi:N-carbamoyl-L-amino-acid hydrolase